MSIINEEIQDAVLKEYNDDLKWLKKQEKCKEREHLITIVEGLKLEY